jgi:hypothetical protein
MNRSALHVKRFDPERQMMLKGFNCLVLGHKHTGKSTLMKDLLYRLHCRGYPRVVVFSGTEESNEFFGSCVPNAYIHSGKDISKLQSIYDVQRKVVASVKEATHQLDDQPPVDTRLVIILDDLMYKKGMTKSELFSEIFLNGRHWGITLIMSCQYVMLLDIACRSNIDYLFVLRETIPRNRIKIYDNFFGVFGKKADFYQVLDACTQGYEALVLDNTSPNLTIDQCVFYYKAELQLPPFVFGDARFQAWAMVSRA